MNAQCEQAWPQLNEGSPFTSVRPQSVGDPIELYIPTITTLRGADTSLEAYPTTDLATLSIISFVLNDTQALSEWRLVAGPADAGDPNGQVAPLDYNLVSNNVSWAKIGGL